MKAGFLFSGLIETDSHSETFKVRICEEIGMFSFGRIHLIQKSILISSVLLMSFCLFAEEVTTEKVADKSADKSTYTLCKNGVAVRTIRVQLKGQSCKAIYTKEGTDQVVGKSGTPSVCYDVASKIRTNLEAGSWKCKDISQTRVSSSLE